MNSADYWRQRAEQNARRVFAYSDRKARLVTRWFGRARREMEKKVRDFYRRYGEGEGISPKAAKAALTDRRALSLSLEEARRLAQFYPQDPALGRLLRQSYLGRAVSREEFLEMQLELLASEAYGEYARETGKSLNEAFEDAYYKSIFDYQQFIGSGNPAFNRLSVHQIQAAVETAWKGANYSQRIWGGQRQSLARYLNRIISTGMMEGKSNGVMTAELQKAMSMSAYQARRLIRTECAQVCARADALAYEENGTPRFQFLATLDMLTSEICREMDGRVFDAAEREIGVNTPPLHPFCRSTTIPYIPDDEFDAGNTRAARNAAGETYTVPASMSYREWREKYVDGASIENTADCDTIKVSKENGGNTQVHFIGKIDKNLYNVVIPDISSEDVIITEQQIAHIKERHPQDFERFSKYFPEILANPDYILEANRPNTAFILKHISNPESDENFEMILRLKVATDPDEYKNSVITFLKINERKWKKYLRNKRILYSRE